MDDICLFCRYYFHVIPEALYVQKIARVDTDPLLVRFQEKGGFVAAVFGLLHRPHNLLIPNPA